MQRRAIYVSHPGARIHRADGLLAVSIDHTVVDRWPPEEVERVLVFGNAQVTTQAIALLLRHGTALSFFSGTGKLRGRLVSPESGNVFLRLAQHARFSDAAFRLELAKDLVRGKIRDGRSLVRRFARNHPQDAEAMGVAAATLAAAAPRVDAVEGLDELRGVEGAAAAAYFKAFGAMVRPPFVFETRSKHPARDEVNALLNLGYTLLAGEVASRLEAAGFDPRIGFYHGVRYGRASLALDLMEIHRVAVIDRLTLSVINRRMFSPDDFEVASEGAGVRMIRPALRRYLSQYEEALGDVAPDGASARTRIQHQVDELRASVMTDSGPSRSPADDDDAVGSSSSAAE
ncbi:MAG: CRISPR-associated endonuclease Cas1 [Nannocystaceae bacterium]